MNRCAIGAVRSISSTAETPLPRPKTPVDDHQVWPVSGGGDHCISFGGCECADIVAHSREQFSKQGTDHGAVLNDEHAQCFHLARCARPRPERNWYSRSPAGNRPVQERSERCRAGAELPAASLALRRRSPSGLPPSSAAAWLRASSALSLACPVAISPSELGEGDRVARAFEAFLLALMAALPRDCGGTIWRRS